MRVVMAATQKGDKTTSCNDEAYLLQDTVLEPTQRVERGPNLKISLRPFFMVAQRIFDKGVEDLRRRTHLCQGCSEDLTKIEPRFLEMP